MAGAYNFGDGSSLLSNPDASSYNAAASAVSPWLSALQSIGSAYVERSKIDAEKSLLEQRLQLMSPDYDYRTYQATSPVAGMTAEQRAAYYEQEGANKRLMIVGGVAAVLLIGVMLLK